MKNLLGALLALLIPVGMLLAVEAVLALLGSPKDDTRYAHPPHFQEHRTQLEFQYDFRTNDQGLRYRDIPLEREAQETRILVLGDSFTEGYGVEADETFGAVLERHAQERGSHRVEFINGGLSGAGPLQYWRMFANVGLRYDLDGLLMCLSTNDVSDTPESVSPESLHNFGSKRTGLGRLLPRLTTLIARLKSKKSAPGKPAAINFRRQAAREARRMGVPADRLEAWNESVPQRLVEAVNAGHFNGRVLSSGLLTPYWLTDALDVDTGRAQSKFRSMIAILDETLMTAAEHEIDVGVVYIPFVLQYDPSQYAPENPLIRTGTQVRREWLTERSEIQRLLEDWARERGVPFLDLTPAFRQAYGVVDSLCYRLDGHWTPNGHRVAADAISSWLEREHLLGFAD